VKSVKELKSEANQSSGPTSDAFFVENLTGQKALDLFHTSAETKRCADCQNDCKLLFTGTINIFVKLGKKKIQYLSLIEMIFS